MSDGRSSANRSVFVPASRRLPDLLPDLLKLAGTCRDEQARPNGENPAMTRGAVLGGTGWDDGRRTHNPKVAGSNPAPATIENPCNGRPPGLPFGFRGCRERPFSSIFSSVCAESCRGASATKPEGHAPNVVVAAVLRSLGIRLEIRAPSLSRRRRSARRGAVPRRFPRQRPASRG